MRSRAQSNVGHQCMLWKLFCVTFRNRRSNTGHLSHSSQLEQMREGVPLLSSSLIGPLYGPGRQRSHASASRTVPRARTGLGRPRVTLGRAAGRAVTETTPSAPGDSSPHSLGPPGRESRDQSGLGGAGLCVEQWLGRRVTRS